MTIFDKLIHESDKDDHQDSQQQRQHNFFFCFNAKQYFDVEEQEIYKRTKSALLLKPSFRQVMEHKPDLYGPFWISTTLIIIIVASSSLITLFDSQKTTYDFDKISVAAGLIYGISFGCPYIITFVMKIMGSDLSVVDLICIYGYSLISFLPITLLCFLDSEVVQMILLAVGYVVSVVFLIRGILRYLQIDLQYGQKFGGQGKNGPRSIHFRSPVCPCTHVQVLLLQTLLKQQNHQVLIKGDKKYPRN